MSQATDILKTYWGYDAFRPLQYDIIEAVMAGKDVLALLPTGGGKSICFQVPAMMKPGLCLVISPLIALMKDQVENLHKKDIPALYIHSGMNFPEVKKTLQLAAFGNYKFLYLSPERLETSLFLEFLPAIKPSLIAVDESHCISQWGYDFRPPYLRIADLRKHLPGVPVIALTASATKEVQDDICKKLAFSDKHLRFQQSFERPNISYSVIEPEAKQVKLLDILNKIPGSSIVYCRSRKHTRYIAEHLTRHGISADFYHAGLSQAERASRQDAWINNRVRVIASTNAFGMGIDKPDVRSVIHYDMPDCLENYYQEAGRAGRDGKKSFAVLLLNKHEEDQLLEQADTRYPPPEELRKIYTGMMNYLQVPAGIGEGQYFPFDLADFCEKFKFNILAASNGMMALAQDGLFSYSDSFFRPSTLVFSCSKEDISVFEQEYPALEPVIKGLLRSYEGIFDQPCQIREKQLARFTGLSESELVNRLKELQKYGIVEYRQQSEEAGLLLLRNRMYESAFLLNTRAHLERKQAFIRRAEAMARYVKDRDACRSVIIGHYFNDGSIRACGICDNCLRVKRTATDISAEKFSLMESRLKMALSATQVKPGQLAAIISPVASDSECSLFIRYLESEQLIETDLDGYVRWIGKN